MRPAAVVVLLLAALACGNDSNPDPGLSAPVRPEPVLSGVEGRSGARGTGDADPVIWRALVPTEPGVPVVTWQDGPVIDGTTVTVGSSVAGRVRLDASTGAVLDRDDHAQKPRRDPWLRGQADVGVTNAVSAHALTIVGIDEQLRAYDGERIVWRSGEDERYAYVPGTLYAGDDLRAVAVDDGIGPTWIDGATGARVRRGDVVSGIGVLGAGWGDDGALAVAVRRDASLRNDAIAVFDPRGMLSYTWSLPALDEPRVDPVGVAVGPAGVFVFHDGRYAVGLRAP